MEVSHAERSLKRKAEEQGLRPRKHQHVVDESLEHDVDEFQPDSPTHGVVVLPASSAHPGEVAERPHSPPSPEDSPAFQIDLTRSQRPSS